MKNLIIVIGSLLVSVGVLAGNGQGTMGQTTSVDDNSSTQSGTTQSLVSMENKPDYVRYVDQNRGEMRFLVAHGNDNSVETVKMRSEELTSDMSDYMEALVKSSDSKTWEVVQH